jgi:hypothetical protein
VQNGVRQTGKSIFTVLLPTDEPDAAPYNAPPQSWNDTQMGVALNLRVRKNFLRDNAERLSVNSNVTLNGESTRFFDCFTY